MTKIKIKIEDEKKNNNKKKREMNLEKKIQKIMKKQKLKIMFVSF
jgi:hypothetical protein